MNSSTMQTGIAPPHGFALSIFLSKRTHSMLGFLASASAAHAPEGPPPTTATLYFWPAAVVSYIEGICISDECIGRVLGILSHNNFLLTKGAGSASGGEEDERGEHCWFYSNVVMLNCVYSDFADDGTYTFCYFQIKSKTRSSDLRTACCRRLKCILHFAADRFVLQIGLCLKKRKRIFDFRVTTNHRK